MRIVLALVAMVLIAPHGAAAQTATTVAGVQRWAFRDWQVHVEARDTGEDWRVTCTMWTGGEGGPLLRIAVSNGDALPPHAYPVPVLHESAPRGYQTQLRDGAWVLFEADVLVEPDTPWRTDGSARAWRDDENIPQAEAWPGGDGLPLLQVMRRAGKLWVTQDGDVVYGASLNGFTAAYGKIAEQCGFPTTGVID